MKIKTALYYIKQGTNSISRNKMMSIASISTVMASLFILGVFFIGIMNVNYFVENIEKSVQIQVFLKDEINDSQKNTIESTIKGCVGVNEVDFESKQQAFEKFKEELGDRGDLVEGIDADKVMPVSFIVKLEGPQYVEGVVQSIKDLEGIDKINDVKSLMDMLIKLSNFIKTLGLIIMIVLIAVSIFLISNTIKLTVVSRKREINIMKYIGATDWFIKWPFIIEGIFLGLIGSLLSFILLCYGYIAVSDYILKEFIIIKPIDIIEIAPYMGIMFIGIGLIIGALGSAISIRKFLHV